MNGLCIRKWKTTSDTTLRKATEPEVTFCKVNEGMGKSGATCLNFDG